MVRVKKRVDVVDIVDIVDGAQPMPQPRKRVWGMGFGA